MSIIKWEKKLFMKEKKDEWKAGKKELIEQNETNQNGDSSFEFMREQIKNRPLNRRKLLKRTLTTAGMAVLFGLIACLTFLLLEPVISKQLNPEEKVANQVTFPEEPAEEEKKFEDLILEETFEEEMEETPMIIQQKVGLDIADYSSLYSKLYFQANVAMKSVVMISGVTEDTDWMSYTYDSKTMTSGLIVADNGQDLLIMAPIKSIQQAEKIMVTFCNNSEYFARLVSTDSNTGIAVLAIPIEEISELTKTQIEYATFGNSNISGLTGNLVIAIGAPMGNYGSVGYGIINGAGQNIFMEDVNYSYFTTDIYCSQSANGFVIDLKGRVLGMITQDYTESDMKNQLSAIGISELSKTLELLSNETQIARVGIFGEDVSSHAHNSYNVPYGAYVSQVAIDSPAMTSGIQSGDVIVSMNTTTINSFRDFTSALRELKPEETVSFTLMRYSGEEYKRIRVNVTLTEKK